MSHSEVGAAGGFGEWLHVYAIVILYSSEHVGLVLQLCISPNCFS